MSQLHHPPTNSNSFLLKHPKCPSLIHLPSGFTIATPKISTKMLAVMLDLWKKNEQTFMAENKKIRCKSKVALKSFKEL